MRDLYIYDFTVLSEKDILLQLLVEFQEYKSCLWSVCLDINIFNIKSQQLRGVETLLVCRYPMTRPFNLCYDF